MSATNALGMLLKFRCLGLNRTRGDNRGRLGPASIDMWAMNRSGGALAGAVAGSVLVALKTDEIVVGDYPPFTTPAAAVGQPLVLGVIHWDAGSVADNAGCWVRIFGHHPYAKVDGTTDVAVGNWLTTHSATAGALEKTTTATELRAIALAARSTNSIGALSIALLDPSGMYKP